MPNEEQKAEIENILRSVSDGKEVPQEIITEVMEIINAPEKNIPTPEEGGSKSSNIDIRMKMLVEPDWRKRAVLAAEIISRSLE